MRTAASYQVGPAFGGHGTAMASAREALHQRGWDSGKRVDRLVRGMKRPRQVVPGLYWTCVLDDAGAVGCIKNKPI